jgi:hypothetical protein
MISKLWRNEICLCSLYGVHGVMIHGINLRVFDCQKVKPTPNNLKLGGVFWVELNTEYGV